MNNNSHKKKLELIKEFAKSWLDDAESYLVELNQNHETAFSRIVEMPEKDLPKHVNSTPSYEARMVAMRLAGKRLLDDPQNLLEPLYDSEFSYEDYKGLGHHDGTLSVLAKIFEILNMKEEEERSYNLMYSD